MKKQIALIFSTFFKFFYCLRYGNRVRFGKKVIVNHQFKFKGRGRVEIGDGANLWTHKEPNEFFTYSSEAIIKVGKGCRINGASIQCKTAVTIGEDCLIGSCMIIDTDFHSIHAEKRNDPAFIKSKPIIIKDRVWLAGQSAILKGVTVGEEAVVGFRALVTKDVAAKTVVAGNPAQAVKAIESIV